MDIKLLDMKNRTLSLLSDAGIKTVEELLSLKEDALYSLCGNDAGVFADIKECLYCLNCPRSFYHNRTCYQSVLHKGRFKGAAEGIECFDFGKAPEKEPGVRGALYVEYHAQPAPVKAEKITLPLCKEDVYCLTVPALYELCKELFLDGTIKPHNSSGVLIELLLKLEEDLSGDGFLTVLQKSHGRLCELLTEKSYGRMPCVVSVAGSSISCIVEQTQNELILHLPADCECRLEDIITIKRDL